MYNYPPPVSLWSVWLYLTAWEKLFLFVLGGVSAYALFSAAITARCIWQTRAATHERNSADVESILVTLRRRSTRVQNLIEATFYLFGIVLFLGLQWAYVILETSSLSVPELVLRHFVAHFVFAFHVFFVLLVLHAVRWGVSSYIDTLCLQSMP
jgi:hypothetical protein